jgi:hypothetical protein
MQYKAKYHVFAGVGVLVLSIFPHLHFEIMPRGFAPEWWIGGIILFIIGFAIFGLFIRSLAWNIIAVCATWFFMEVPDAWTQWQKLGTSPDIDRSFWLAAKYGGLFFAIHIILQLLYVYMGRKRCQEPK